ncbi:MAG: alpha/beta fold hydrolase [Actinomycetota bacterium]|nr:alpha/beta fold hydrolase [Actinomycetota bacterium]
MAWETRRARVKGVPLRWEESGEGLPVVFIHGIPTGPALWRDVIPKVEGAHCLVFEMVGYAESIPEGRERDISVSRQADYLLAWLDELGTEQAVFVGHDLGGGVAQIAAVRAPQRCAGLVLTNSICYDSWPIPSVKALRSASPLVRRLPDVLIKTMIASLLLRGHDDLRRARESLAIHWRPYEQFDSASAMARQVEALNVRDTLAIVDQLATLDVPARVVWGAADAYQKVTYGHRLAGDLRTELRRIEGGKHFTPEDHPDAIAAATNEVVADLRERD